MTILLADDDRSSRHLLREIVALDPRHELIEVGDGEEAWTLLRDSQRHFDVVILDLSVPPLDGLGLTERIRTSAGLRQLPVILCTADTTRETVQRAGQLSIRHFVVKPYRKELLEAKLQAVAVEVATSTDANNSAAERLGISANTAARLTSELTGEVRLWLASAREAQTPHEFTQLTIQANALKCAADKLRLPVLSRALSEVETKFTTDFSTQYGEMLPPSVLEIAAELVVLQTELDRITSRLGLQR